VLLSTAIIASVGLTGAALAQKRGGTLVQLTSPEPPTLASYINTSLAVPQVTGKIYDGLLEYDFNLKPQPSLAESFEVSPDGKTIAFKLRKNVKFHDGTPFTSADVQFTFMEVLKKVNPRGIGSLRELEAVDTPDPYTAVFRLANPTPYLIMALSGADAPIIPKHIFSVGDIRNHPNANKPIGTGPFKLVEWRKGEFIRLDRNPDYWRPGMPYLDRVVVRFIPDASTRTALLEKGEAHLAGYGSVPFDQAKRLATNPNIEVTTKGYEMFSIVESLTFNTTRKPFDNVKVRQAISYGIDRQFIVDNAYFGYAKVATGQISSNFEKAGFYTNQVKNYSAPDGLAIAGKLLDEAGFPKKENGTRLELTLDTTAGYGEYYQRSAEVVQQNLARIGVKVNIRSEDVPTWLNRVFTQYDFDMTQVGLANLADPVLGAYRALHSVYIKKGAVFTNNSQWSTPHTDELMDKAARELDPVKRGALYKELQQLAAEAAPAVWVLETQFPTAYNKSFKNVIVSPQGLQGSFYSTWLDK
jgi:peptide/nickel transport system substrate-binding protein